jgi:hypothetical protein
MRIVTLLISLLFYSPTHDSKLVEVRKSEVKKEVKKVLPQKNIIIGDSQSPFVDWGSADFNLISTVGGQGSLWLGGKTLGWLLEAVKVYPGDTTVTGVAIVVGTNGGFNKSDKISELVTECKLKFPNSKFYVVQGSWGWGGVSNKTEKQVRDYYLKFAELGVQVVEPPIGRIEPHGRKPIYKIIGKNLDSLVKTN